MHPQQTRLEQEHYQTAVADCADLHARLLKLQETARHALLRAEREAALWRGAEHKREVMHQHVHEQEAVLTAPPMAMAPAVAPVVGEN